MGELAASTCEELPGNDQWPTVLRPRYRSDAERGIPPSVVENTIQHGTPFAGNRAGTQGFYDPVNRVRVIINSDNGTVVTVIPGGG